MRRDRRHGLYNTAADARMVAREDRPLDRLLLGAWCGPSLAPFFRQAELTDIRRKGWLVERWAPPPPATRQYVAGLLRYFAGLAGKHDVPQADLEAWRVAAADPDRLLDDPDFCFRESFVTTVGRVPA